MADDKLITNIKFEACARRKSLVGFVDFIYRTKFTFTDVAVHERLDRTGFRLVYPQTAYPIDHPMQKEIDHLISEHIRKTQGVTTNANTTNTASKRTPDSK